MRRVPREMLQIVRKGGERGARRWRTRRRRRERGIDQVRVDSTGNEGSWALGQTRPTGLTARRGGLASSGCVPHGKSLPLFGLRISRAEEASRSHLHPVIPTCLLIGLRSFVSSRYHPGCHPASGISFMCLVSKAISCPETTPISPPLSLPFRVGYDL